MISQYNILIKGNITYIHSPQHVYKIILSHPYSIIIFDKVFKKVLNDKYSISSFILIKYTTPKTYYYIAPIKICEFVKQAFLYTLIV
jgi:hypothetical protein